MQNIETTKLGRLELATVTDVGRERELNKDTVWGMMLRDGADNPWRLSARLPVADGMGGHDAGEVSSSLTAQTIREIITSPQIALPRMICRVRTLHFPDMCIELNSKI